MKLTCNRCKKSKAPAEFDTNKKYASGYNLYACKQCRKVGRIFMKKPKRYEWANISGKYMRDIKDYIQLCPSCHRKWDMGLIKINI